MKSFISIVSVGALVATLFFGATASTYAQGTGIRVHADVHIASSTKLDATKRNNIKKVVDNHISVYTKNSARLEARIKRIEVIANRVNATDAKAKLTDAKTILAHASLTLKEIKGNATTASLAQSPGNALQLLKLQFDGVNADIKSAHRKITDAISSLKGNGLKANINAHGTTTTSSPTN